MYKLDPVKAYDLGLVKQIEVDSVMARNNTSGAFIGVDGFKIAKQSITAKITLLVNGHGGVQKKQVTAKIGDDLFMLSKEREMYKEGCVITHLDAENGFIEFSGGHIVHKGQAVGGLTDQVLKEMIDATVENHFKKEKALSSLGIKVLSIFFIDRVVNYRSYDEQGKPIKGKYALWLEESFLKWQNIPAYKDLYAHTADEMHDGYFSQDKGKMKDSKEGKSTKADDETFKLIMQDKERLLDRLTPLRFIFSHSALREGWDNPNVFQICTLNETKSTVKKRQEIGRGLRLCVDQSGLRNLDPAVNRLTVIANEAYDSFVKALQKEIEEETGVKFEGRIKNARARKRVQLKEKWLEDTLFLALWDKIKYQTTYQVNYSTGELIDHCIAAIKEMPAIEKPTIYREKNVAKFNRDEQGNLTGLGGDLKSSVEMALQDIHYEIPDFVSYIQSKTMLTRDTVTQVILQSNRLGEIFNNPQLFMDTVVRIIKQELEQLKVKDIRYEKIAGQVYETKVFEAAEVEQYLENLVAVKKPAKTLYNFVAIDSLTGPEKQFAADCDVRDDVLFYVKLPKAFQIKTPVGPYHPGWALIKRGSDGEASVFFVAQTKDHKMFLRNNERIKMACAAKHFEAIGHVHYRLVESVNDLKI